MVDKVYQVMFKAEVRHDQKIETVKAQATNLLKLSAQQAEVMFSGRSVVIKAGLTKDKALHYQRMFEKIGAIVHLLEVPMEQNPASNSRGTPSSLFNPQGASKKILNDKPAIVIQEAPTDDQEARQEDSWSIAPVGAELMPKKTVVDRQNNIDISHLKLLEVGCDLQEEYQTIPDLNIDTPFGLLD